jgi:hypothetical protein
MHVIIARSSVPRPGAAQAEGVDRLVSEEGIEVQ